MFKLRGVKQPLIVMHQFKKQNTMKTKTIVLTVILTILTMFQNGIFAQNFLYGYQYSVNTDDYTKFKYTRTYSGSGDEFVTTYNIYHPTKGYHAITITATHKVSEKKVVVKVEYATGGIFSDICTEETTYETPALEPFGFRGAVGALGGNRVPNQLMVKFVSTKYENVKVVHVNGTAPGESEFIFYVLDEK